MQSLILYFCRLRITQKAWSFAHCGSWYDICIWKRYVVANLKNASKLLNMYYRPKALICVRVQLVFKCVFYGLFCFLWLFSPQKKGDFTEEMRCCILWLVDVFGEMYCNHFWPCSCVWFSSLVPLILVLHWAFTNAELLAFHFMFVCQCN